MIAITTDKAIVEYQENLRVSRNTKPFFKHLKSLNKSVSLPKVIIKVGKSTSTFLEKSNFFSFDLVTQTNFNIENIKCKYTKLTKFDTSRVVISNHFNDLINRKSRGQMADHPCFPKKL